MSETVKITQLRVTPIAIQDPPLLNSTGVHQPFALRSIIELETDDGRVGLGETYGDSAMLRNLDAVADEVEGLDPFDLNGLLTRVRSVISDTKHGGNPLAPGTHGDKDLAKVFGALEVACLDLQGQIVGRSVASLLGGAVRPEVPYSAYLFFKFGEHKVPPGYEADSWGEALTPESMVEQARTMIDQYGFGSIKLKGGVLEPEAEIETVRQLRDAFPEHPLRIDPNAAWGVETSIQVAKSLEGVLEYLEDPTPTLEGMAQVAKESQAPLATNMVVTSFAHVPQSVRMDSVGVILADHHYWGGLRATQHLANICAVWGLGLSMHSNSHLGISLAAMTHVAASTPNLSYACDTHYPWQTEDVIEGGRLEFQNGALAVPRGPGLGVTLDRSALDRLHTQYLECGTRDRDDIHEMRKYDPSWTGTLPRF